MLVNINNFHTSCVVIVQTTKIVVVIVSILHEEEQIIKNHVFATLGTFKSGFMPFSQKLLNGFLRF